MLTRYDFTLPYADAVTVFHNVKDRPYAVFLDSADQTHPLGQQSIIGFNPVEILTPQSGRTSFEYCQERLDVWISKITQTDAQGTDASFWGGIMGLWSYDLGRELEVLPEDTADVFNMPDMCAGIYLNVIVFDHKMQSVRYTVCAENEIEANKHYNDVKEFYSRAVKSRDDIPEIPIRTKTERNEFLSKIQQVIDFIYQGDIFQANLSLGFEGQVPSSFPVYDFYRKLRDVNAAPYGVYFNMGEAQLLSVSPEQFLSVKDGKVETRPIKGTCPQGKTPDKDKAARHDLMNSAKNKAENVMIVDLLRNDISRVCDPYSVDVPALWHLESYAEIHHMVSVVTGRLEDGRTCTDALAACFPGGSITGAPKIRAMEIVEELEAERRWAYTGSAGYIGFNDVMDTNILIRTMVFKDGKVRFNVGSGIVADSVPAEEYDEIMAKAAGILKSFVAAGDDQEKEYGHVG